MCQLPATPHPIPTPSSDWCPSLLLFALVSLYPSICPAGLLVLSGKSFLPGSLSNPEAAACWPPGSKAPCTPAPPSGHCCPHALSSEPTGEAKGASGGGLLGVYSRTRTISGVSEQKTESSVGIFNSCCSDGKSCLTLCNPMDCSTPGSSVLHYLPEFAQTHVHLVDDAIKPFHPLSSPSPFVLNLNKHEYFPMNQLFESGGQSIRPSASVFPTNIQGGFPLILTGLISQALRHSQKVNKNI